MNSDGKVEFLAGAFFKSPDLGKLNQYLANNHQNFQFSLIEKSTFKIEKQALGIIIAGDGLVSGDFSSWFETNDILLLSPGEYDLNAAYFQILKIAGENLFENPGIIKQTDLPILSSTLGGTRKLLKANYGKFNIDVHLIWVDEKNIKTPHYHTTGFELYLVEAGSGEILLKKPEMAEWQARPELKPGIFVLVPPEIVHRAQGKDLVIQVIGIPAFYHHDYVIVG